MIVQRDTLPILSGIFARIGNIKFNINTQYKLLKIKKVIDEEAEIYGKQMERLMEFCVRDENGDFIKNDKGGFEVQPDKIDECNKIVEEINSIEVQFPDLYFQLEEFEPLDLTFKELEALDPFIRI